METLMVVGSDPAADRHIELNRWYSWVHIRDVMRLPGSLSAQRFVLSPVQPETNPDGTSFSYLALYEIDDKAACNKGHNEDVFTDKMLISTAFDFDAFHEAYFDPFGGTPDRLPVETAEQPVMLIAADAGESDSAAFEAMLTARALDDIAALPGFSSALSFRFGTDQMMDLPARNSHLILAHLSDVSLAAPTWDRFVGASLEPWRTVRLRAEIYLPLMRRLHAVDVLGESDHARAIGLDARLALGDAVHRPGSNQYM